MGVTYAHLNKGELMSNNWLVVMVLSMFVVSVLGSYKRFVVTVPDGDKKHIIVDRYSVNVVKKIILGLTCFLGLSLAIDNALYSMRLGHSIWWWAVCRLPIIAVVAGLHMIMCNIIYNIAREKNDRDVRDELLWKSIKKKDQ